MLGCTSNPYVTQGSDRDYGLGKCYIGIHRNLSGNKRAFLKQKELVRTEHFYLFLTISLTFVLVPITFLSTKL